MVNLNRVRKLKKGRALSGPVLYWMSRDQRVDDNWALLYACEIAENSGQYVMVVFTLIDNMLGATWRQYDFMLKGLRKVEKKLNGLKIPFVMLHGDPADTLPHYISYNKISHLVCDFDPLRIKRQWIDSILNKIDISADEVDAHNIVPCTFVSEKEEYGAFTLRPKIARLLPEFMDEYPTVIRQRQPLPASANNWEAFIASLQTDRSVLPVSWAMPGEDAARSVLDRFIQKQLNQYHQKKNDPNADCTSKLSPYIRFGQISTQRIALDILKSVPRDPSVDAFLEELIVRKELADNFCFHNTGYDKITGLRQWAKNTLDDHKNDNRQYIYDPLEFERATTHDTLWNAAQHQLVKTGTIHGYMRMYWAKKILEWSPDPESAYQLAIYLNDKYQLDGRCANGYTGCAWSIGGIHDRPWKERAIFGKIRYMNRAGCERKFDVDHYIRSFSP